ncbi:MAG: hypothetical protein WBM17_12125 [Anaerolineales bacterium]
MKRSLPAFALLAIVLLGCSLFTTTAQEGTSQPGAAQNSDGTQAPTKKATLPPETNTSCNELSFFLNQNLATKVKCETIPESGGADSAAFDTYPPYTKVTFVGYPLSGMLMQPVISVFPVERFAELLPDVVDPDVSALQALIAGGAPGDGDPPILPVQNAQQLFLAQYAVLSFQNGSGVGYITQYAQAYVPINNHDLFFSFQGLTSDGKYWISVILPINHPSLWETQGDPSNSIYATIKDDPDSYYSQLTAEVNAKAPRSFVPILSLLTDLVKSMVIAP